MAARLDHIDIGSPITPFYEALRGGPISTVGLGSAWRTLKKESGVNRHLWLHDLRRTAAVSLYALTKDLTAVEAFLGHASLSSTCGYLEHKDPAKLRAYIDQMWKPRTAGEAIQ